MTTGPKPQTVRERIEARRVMIGDCWIWPGSRVNKLGYRQMWVGSRTDGTRRRMLAHVASYEAFVGPVPDGLELDHRCRVPACCNPDHLEPVTRTANMRRAIAARGLDPGTWLAQLSAEEKA